MMNNSHYVGKGWVKSQDSIQTCKPKKSNSLSCKRIVQVTTKQHSSLKQQKWNVYIKHTNFKVNN